jgi:hypothetical protein
VLWIWIRIGLARGLRIRIHFLRIRIQHLRMTINPDPDPIRVQGFHDKKLKKNDSWKFFLIFIFDQKLQFTYP